MILSTVCLSVYHTLWGSFDVGSNNSGNSRMLNIWWLAAAPTFCSASRFLKYGESMWWDSLRWEVNHSEASYSKYAAASQRTSHDVVSVCCFRTELHFAWTAALFSSLACIWSSAKRREKQLGETAFSSEAVFPPRPIDFHHVKMKSDVSPALPFWSLAFAQLPNKAAASVNADWLSPLIHSVWTAGGQFISKTHSAGTVYSVSSDSSPLSYTIVSRSYWRLSHSWKNNY